MVWNHTVKRGYVADTNLQMLDFLRNLFMLKMKSDFNPIYPRSLKKQSWHVIHQIKSTHMDYLELKGFWNPTTYSQEKWGVRCDTNYGTHCRRERLKWTKPLKCNGNCAATELKLLTGHMRTLQNSHEGASIYDVGTRGGRDEVMEAPSYIIA